jgi:plastocyanin
VELRRLRLGLAALLGVAVVVLPAIASSETPPSISAVNQTNGKVVTHFWSPATATVGEGGEVTLANPSETPHGVDWIAGPATPSCEGVPVGTTVAASGTNWHGSCRFASAGVYTFYCTVHGPEMTGTITVDANGTTTTTMSTGSSGQTPGSQSPLGAPASSPGIGAAGAPAGQPGSLPAGNLATVKLAATQHGQVVRGSLQVSPAGAGGRLEVQLLAPSASLATATASARIRVGRLVRASVPAGVVRYSVTLDARARHALRLRRHLTLAAKIAFAAPHAPAVTFARTVTLRG